MKKNLSKCSPGKAVDPEEAFPSVPPIRNYMIKFVALSGQKKRCLSLELVVSLGHGVKTTQLIMTWGIN